VRSLNGLRIGDATLDEDENAAAAAAACFLCIH